MSRLLALLLPAFCSLSLTSCNSPTENAGKIVGKWKKVSSTKPDPNDEQLKLGQLYFYFEFTEDGSVALGMDSEIEHNRRQLRVQNNGQDVRTVGKYTLGSGKRVRLAGMKDKDGKGVFNGKDGGVVEITVDGDTMTLKSADETMTFTRVVPKQADPPTLAPIPDPKTTPTPDPKGSTKPAPPILPKTQEETPKATLPK